MILPVPPVIPSGARCAFTAATTMPVGPPRNLAEAQARPVVRHRASASRARAARARARRTAFLRARGIYQRKPIQQMILPAAPVIPSGARCAMSRVHAESCRAPEESSRGPSEARRAPPRLGLESPRRAACAHRCSARGLAISHHRRQCRGGRFYGGGARCAARARCGRDGGEGDGPGCGRGWIPREPARLIRRRGSGAAGSTRNDRVWR
jgi:hypothetical protein